MSATYVHTFYYLLLFEKFCLCQIYRVIEQIRIGDLTGDATRVSHRVFSMSVYSNRISIFTCWGETTQSSYTHFRRRDAPDPCRSSRISLRGFLRYLGTNRRKIVPINRKTRRENHFTSQEPQDESGPTKPTRPGG